MILSVCVNGTERAILVAKLCFMALTLMLAKSWFRVTSTREGHAPHT